MSSAWSWYVVILTITNIVGCFWLMRWSSKQQPGESAEGEVTGHTWDDDLQEYNNPLPRWWLWLFYISLAFAIIYLILYPGLGNFSGIWKWDQKQQYQEEVKRASMKYDKVFEAYAQKDLVALSNDRDAMKAGQRLFLTYCSTCHGSTATGAKGFPNLTDNDWLHGATPDAIKTSIVQGRLGSMPAMGGALGDEGVSQVVNYIMQLNGRSHDPDQALAGKSKFDMFCVACHQADAKGNTAIGAPNLTDDIWLHGGSTDDIRATIVNGRSNQMPPHGDFLGEEKSHLLAAYVYSLGGK